MIEEMNKAEAFKSGINLRKATEADIETYIAIDKKLGSRTYSSITDPDDVREEMHKGPVYIIEKDGEPAGMISYEVRPDGTVYLSGLGVDPAYQSQGIGREALKYVLEEVAHAPKVELLTHPDNSAAIKLYESFGFKITGRKENYFGDGEPRVVLTLEQ